MRASARVPMSLLSLLSFRSIVSRREGASSKRWRWDRTAEGGGELSKSTADDDDDDDDERDGGVVSASASGAAACDSRSVRTLEDCDLVICEEAPELLAPGFSSVAWYISRKVSTA